MENKDILILTILKYSNNEELKNTLADITYIKHVIQFKSLFEFDEYKLNLKNACKLIYDNQNITKEDKMNIFNYVKQNA